MNFRKLTLALITLASIGVAVNAYAQNSQSVNNNQPLQTVDFVDVERYMGNWYEIARLPMPYQKQCVANVTANYHLNDDGSITVTNRCQTASGDWSVSQGLAKAVSDDNSKLTVTFLPKWLRWLPVGDAPYWVMALDDKYQTAMVGQPSREYLWILSRTPVMNNAVYEAYLNQAKDAGYRLDGLIETVQDKTQAQNFDE